MPCGRLLQRPPLSGIPVIIIYINDFFLVILLIIHFLFALHGKLRLGNRNDQLVPHSDHGIFIIKRRVELDQTVQWYIGIKGDAGKRVPGLHLVDLVLLLILGNLLDGSRKIRQLISGKISLDHLNAVPEIHGNQAEIIILEGLFEIRLHSLKNLLDLSVKPRTHTYGLLNLLLRLLSGNNLGRQNRQLSRGIQHQIHRILIFGIIFVNCSLKKALHFVFTGKVDHQIIDLHHIRPVPCMADVALKHRSHIGDHKLLLVHLPPEYLASRILHIAFHKNQLIASGRNTPSCLFCIVVRLFRRSHHSHLNVV